MSIRRLVSCLLAVGLMASAAAAADWTEVSRGNPDRMEVALTFDAGGYIDNPDDFAQKSFRTNTILDVLESRNIRVTTFVTQLMVDNYPDNIARFIRNGYEFGNHSINHPHFTAKNGDGSWTYTTDYLLNSQVLAEENVLRTAYSGRTARPWFRFPYGERDARTLDVVRKAGYRSVFWGCGGTDSNAPTVDATAIKNSVLPKLVPGLVILLHWQGYHTHEAIADIVDSIKASGYEFVTLSEVMAPTPADGAVLDNSDASAAITGNWTATNTTTGRFGGDYHYIAGGGSGANTFTWSTDLPTGQYNVYAWWTSGTNRTSNAPYTVNYSGGSATVRVSQKTNGGMWVLLGTYNFAGGTPARVTLADNAGTTAQVVIADAVKFVPTTAAPAFAPSWTCNIGSPIVSSPSIDNGIAYVGADNGNFYAINVTNGTAGQVRWSQSLGSAIRTRPMLYNSIAYVTTTGGRAVALDLTDGHVIWNVPVGTGELTTPAPFGSTLMVGSADGHVYRLAMGDGAITATSGDFGGPIKSMPTVRNTDLVWVGMPNGDLCCLSSDLSLIRWTVSSGPLALDAPSYINWAGDTLVVGSGSSTLLMVNAGNGGPACPVFPTTPQLTTDSVNIAGAVSGSAWIDAGTNMAYYGTSRGMVYGTELSSSLWPAQWPLRVVGSGSFSASPLLMAGPLGAKFLYIGSDAGKFFAIPAGMPGKYRVYTDSTPGVRFASSPAVSGATAQDRVIVGTSDGRILAFPVL